MAELEERIERLEQQMRDLFVVVAGVLVNGTGHTTQTERGPLTAAFKAYVQDPQDAGNYRRVLEELDAALEARARRD
jgi:hypothetical protein